MSKSNMAFRAIIVLILLFPLAGFGICGVMGVIGGVESHQLFFALLGLLGIAISASFGYFIVQLLKAKKPTTEQRDSEK